MVKIENYLKMDPSKEIRFYRDHNEIVDKRSGILSLFGRVWDWVTGASKLGNIFQAMAKDVATAEVSSFDDATKMMQLKDRVQIQKNDLSTRSWFNRIFRTHGDIEVPVNQLAEAATDKLFAFWTGSSAKPNVRQAELTNEIYSLLQGNRIEWPILDEKVSQLIDAKEEENLVAFYRDKCVGPSISEQVKHRLSHGKEDNLLVSPKVEDSKYANEQLEIMEAFNGRFPLKQGAISSFNQSYAEQAPPVGVTNIGNNCYFNTAVQWLMSHIELLSEQELATFVQENKECNEFVELYQEAQSYRTNIDFSDPRLNNFKQFCRDKGVDSLDGGAGSAAKVIEALHDTLSEPSKQSRMITYASDPEYSFTVGLAEQMNAPDENDYRLDSPPKHLNFTMNDTNNGRKDTLHLKFGANWTKNNEPAEYECNFISIHIGTNELGHYFCLRKVGQQWYQINDDKVDPIRADEVLNLVRGGAEKMIYGYKRVT
jgi:hypothetical protein